MVLESGLSSYMWGCPAHLQETVGPVSLQLSPVTAASGQDPNQMSKRLSKILGATC